MKPQTATAVIGLLLAACTLCAQGLPENHAIVNGKPVTMSQLESLLGPAPPELRTKVMQNPDELFQYYGFMDRLAALAEAAKLEEESPYKEQIELSRKQVLAQAAMENYYKSQKISPADERQYYDQHPDAFTFASVKAIYVPSLSGAADGARKEAADLWKQATAGTDFVALARQHPPAKDSKDGAIGPIRKDDAAIPAAIRDAVFRLKPGQVSSPVEQPAGVYIFRLESLSIKPFPDVQGEIWKAIADSRQKAWLDEVRKSVTVEKRP